MSAGIVYPILYLFQSEENYFCQLRKLVGKIFSTYTRSYIKFSLMIYYVSFPQGWIFSRFKFIPPSHSFSSNGILCRTSCTVADGFYAWKDKIAEAKRLVLSDGIQ
jgi:hypothetical protein